MTARMVRSIKARKKAMDLEEAKSGGSVFQMRNHESIEMPEQAHHKDSSISFSDFSRKNSDASSDGFVPRKDSGIARKDSGIARMDSGHSRGEGGLMRKGSDVSFSSMAREKSGMARKNSFYDPAVVSGASSQYSRSGDARALAAEYEEVINPYARYS